MASPKDATLHLRLPAALKKRLEAIAERRHTDLSELIRQVLAEWARQTNPAPNLFDKRDAGQATTVHDPAATYGDAIPPLVAAIQEQTAAINKLLERSAEEPTLRLHEATGAEDHTGGHGKRRKSS